jgi:hypothetical protein
MELTDDLVDVAIDAFKMAEPTLNKTQRMLVAVEAVLHSLPQPVHPAALTDEQRFKVADIFRQYRDKVNISPTSALDEAIKALEAVLSRRTAQPA